MKNKQTQFFFMTSFIAFSLFFVNLANAGSFCGTVYDMATDNTIINVVISAGNNIGTHTDGNGEFCLTDLPPQGYDITFSKSGYRLKTITEFIGTNDHFEDQKIYLTCPGVFNIITQSLPDCYIEDKAYNQRIYVECGLPYDYSVWDGALPSGLTLDKDTGNISGWCTTPGLYSFTIGVYDNDGNYADWAYDIQVLDPLRFLTPSRLISGTKNNDYRFTFSATGGEGPYEFSLTNSEQIPEDFTLSNNGRLSGKPLQVASYYFFVRVTDKNGLSQESQFYLQIGEKLSISTSRLDDGIVSEQYTQQIAASGGYGAFSWTVHTGQIPTGLFLDPVSGVITGRPVQADYQSIIIAVTDEDGHIAYHPYTLRIADPLIIEDYSIPVIQDNEETYYKPITISGGFGPYTFNAENLPEWLEINKTNGVLTILPNNHSGSKNVKITVTDSRFPNPQSTAKVLDIRLETVLSILNSPVLPDVPALIEIPSILLETIGGHSPMSWSADFLPDDISLDADSGILSGTPKVSGNMVFSINVLDSNHQQAEQKFYWHIYEELSFLPQTMDAIVGLEFIHVLQVKGGKKSYFWRIVNGDLPEGLSFNSQTGVISGTPIKPQTLPVTIEVSDNVNSKPAEKEFIIDVINTEIAVSPAEIPNGKIGVPYNARLSVSLGNAPFKFEIPSGVLPDGLDMETDQATAIIKGVPTMRNKYEFTLTVTDSKNNSYSRVYNINIVDSLEFDKTHLRDAKTGTNYSEKIWVSKGVPPYVWELSRGHLPSGLSLNPATGVISGNVSDNATTQSFTIKVTDYGEFSSSKEADFVIFVKNCPLNITTVDIGEAIINREYKMTLMADCGFKPYQWMLIYGELPDGITLNSSSGMLSGTPTQQGEYGFIVRLTDASEYPEVTTQSYQLKVKSDKYNISGNVTIEDSESHISLSLLDFNTSESIDTAITDYNGNYSFQNVPNGKYKVSPLNDNCKFRPPYLIVTVSMDDIVTNPLEAMNCTHSEDNNPPTPPTNLKSSINIRTWSPEPRISFSWTPSQDSESGVHGYQYLWNTHADSDAESISSVRTPHTDVIIDDLPEGNNIYFHVCAIDNAGNTSDTKTIGPFYIDRTPPEDCSVYIKKWLDDTHVKLALYAVDHGSGMGDISISNDALQWSTPEQYTNETSWEMLPDNQFVFVQFSDKAGNSSIVRNDSARFIIFGGGNADLNNLYWESTVHMTTEVYRNLSTLGFKDDMIYFMINSQMIDLNYDSIPDSVVDDTKPEKQDFLDVISNQYVTSLNPNTPLFIYMQGHGTSSKEFYSYVNPDGNPSEKVLNAESIRNALDSLQSQVDCKVVLILEACYSGGFIPDLINPSYPDRIILTSAGFEPYHTDASGYLSFSAFLFAKLREGDHLKKAFEFAKTKLINLGFPAPQMDDNSNGIYDDKDGLLASSTYLNFPYLSWSIPVIQSVTIENKATKNIQIAAVIHEDHTTIDKVWANVISPGTNMKAGSESIEFPETELTFNAETERYESNIISLEEQGQYKVVVHARNNRNETAMPFIQYAGTIAGDLNTDGFIDMSDVIRLFQYLGTDRPKTKTQ
jgi:hypothetical protein